MKKTQCERCLEIFSDGSHLRQHQKRSTDCVLNKFKYIKQKPFKCKPCDRTFTRLRSLQLHYNTPKHHKRMEFIKNGGKKNKKKAINTPNINIDIVPFGTITVSSLSSEEQLSIAASPCPILGLLNVLFFRKDKPERRNVYFDKRKQGMIYENGKWVKGKTKYILDRMCDMGCKILEDLVDTAWNILTDPAKNRIFNGSSYMDRTDPEYGGFVKLSKKFFCDNLDENNRVAIKTSGITNYSENGTSNINTFKGELSFEQALKKFDQSKKDGTNARKPVRSLIDENLKLVANADEIIREMYYTQELAHVPSGLESDSDSVTKSKKNPVRYSSKTSKLPVAKKPTVKSNSKTSKFPVAKKPAVKSKKMPTNKLKSNKKKIKDDSASDDESE
jgi:hypothetical protein